MKILVEMNAATGEQCFVVQSKSERRYTGATPEEAIRKYYYARLNAYKRQIGEEIYRLTIENETGKHSLKELSVEQLTSLLKTFSEANEYSTRVTAPEAAKQMTEAQRKKIVRLGQYVLGQRYHKNWFWEKLREWTGETTLDHLTLKQADYVIKRLERMEYQASKYNKSKI